MFPADGSAIAARIVSIQIGLKISSPRDSQTSYAQNAAVALDMCHLNRQNYLLVILTTLPDNFLITIEFKSNTQSPKPLKKQIPIRSS